jgi:hypothetical protein
LEIKKLQEVVHATVGEGRGFKKVEPQVTFSVARLRPLGSSQLFLLSFPSKSYFLLVAAELIR